MAQGRYEQALSVLEIEAMLPRRILRDERFFPRSVPFLSAMGLLRPCVLRLLLFLPLPRTHRL